MSRDTFNSIAGEVHAQTTLDYELCKLYVRDAFRELQEHNTPWSWQISRGIFTCPSPYTTGLASISAQGSTLVNLSGATLDPSMSGRQFRLGIGDPWYDITSVDPVANTITIDPPWADVGKFNSSYTISQVYFTVPDDFYSFLVVIDPLHAWRLNLNVPQSTIDWWDPKRSNSGNPLLLSPRDYSKSYSGKVGPIITISNAGGSPIPSSSGSYSGATDSIVSIVIDGTGALDAATFTWSVDGVAQQSSIVVSSLGNVLPNGVGISWPLGIYSAGDTFALLVRPVANPSVPRYEIYPAPTEQLIFPFQYVARYPDISDFGITIPRYIPGSFIKEGALGRAARTAGTDDKPNPYAQIARAENHENRFSGMVEQLVQNDQEVFTTSIFAEAALPYAPLPWGTLLGGRPLTYDPLWIYPDIGGLAGSSY